MFDNSFIKLGEILLYNPSKEGTEFFPGFEGSYDDFNLMFKERIHYLLTIPRAVPEYLERNLHLKKTLKDFRRSLKNTIGEVIFSYCYSAPDPSQGIIILIEYYNIVFVREKNILNINDKNNFINFIIVNGKKKSFVSWIKMSNIDRKIFIEKNLSKTEKLLPTPITATITYK